MDVKSSTTHSVSANKVIQPSTRKAKGLLRHLITFKRYPTLIQRYARAGRYMLLSQYVVGT